MAWAQGFSGAMATHATGGVYVNLIAHDEPHRVPSAFSDHDRLRTMKAEWDPDNISRNNHKCCPRSKAIDGWRARSVLHRSPSGATPAGGT